MDLTAKLASIQRAYPYRDTQTAQLMHFINQHDTNNIVVYGPRATGKTSIIQAIVNEFRLFHVWINILHYPNARNIYESILRQTKKQLNDRQNDSHPEMDLSCNNSIVFVEKLRFLLVYFGYDESAQVCQSKLVIVLDNVDALVKDDNEEFIYLMNSLENLVETICPITVIYISTHSVDWLMRNSEFKSSVHQIIFNNYSNDELLHLLTSRPLLNHEYSQELYSNYVNIILKSLTPFTRNFAEIQNICHVNFAYFVQPIENDEMTIKDLNRLFLKFQPRLQEIIESLPDHKIVRLKSSIEMSPSMNYLLVAAYLASYNSIKSDKRYFVRNQGRFKERRKRTKKSADVEEKAPKPFTFERIFNIYQALLNLNEYNINNRRHLLVSSLVFQQLNELIKQNLIFALKSTNNTASISSNSKYQLSEIVTTKHIEEVAHSIRLNLKAFCEVK